MSTEGKQPSSDVQALNTDFHFDFKPRSCTERRRFHLLSAPQPAHYHYCPQAQIHSVDNAISLRVSHFLALLDSAGK